MPAAGETSDLVTIYAETQPLHTVCPLYEDVFGRKLLISPLVEGREIRLGPLNATREEMRSIIPSVLASAGYSIRKVSENVDMIEQALPTPAQGDTPAPTRIPLLYANAQDLVKAASALYPQATTNAPVTAGATYTPPPPPPSLVAAPDNSIHFNGTESQLATFRSFVATMDAPARLVRVRAIIGHVQLGSDISSGLDWLTALDDIGGGNNGGRSLIIPTKAPVPAISLYGNMGSLSRYLKLVEEDRNFRTDSRPSLFVRSGSTAEITTGERLAFPQTVLTTATGQASTSATVSYQEILLRLKIEALVNSKDQITLTITQANDTVTGTSTISGNQVPNIGSQSLTTQIMIESGSTVALGGIVTNIHQAKERGVHKLRKLPLIGRLFETRSKTATQEELIILIEATVDGEKTAAAKR